MFSLQKNKCREVPIVCKPKILIIDDRPDNLLAIKAVLKSPDYQLIFANSGENALRCLLQQDDFAVILLDVQMPGMDGFETARIIRSRKRNSNIPIIFVTAIYKSEEHIVQGYNLGAIDYLFKPLHPKTLKSKVDAFVKIHLQSQHLIHRSELRINLMYKKLKENKRKVFQLSEQLQDLDGREKNFISMLSHEIRNPLASIMMSIALQKQVRPGGEEDRKTREIIERQTAQLSRLVNDLLDISRINENKISIKKECVDLNKLVQQATVDYQGHFTKKCISLEIILSPAPIYLKVDPVRLVQVIGNLLHNAAKFTNKGDKAIVTVSRDKNKREAVLTVQDTGIGVRQEILPDLFEPFMQADNGLARSKGGLGLGLTIVKNLVEMHNGSVDVYSEGMGQGTKFTIRLPITKDNEQVSMAGYLSSHFLKILLIDDIPEITEILGSLLGYLGHQVITASSGPEGIDKAKEFRPDILICDIGMPGMSGYEVARIFRNDDELKEVYLIALSAYAQPEDLEQSKAAGFRQHLAKPVDLDTLKGTLAQIR